MRRVIKRFLTRDASGRPISTQSERLTDDGDGGLQVTSERTASRCSGCQRAVADFSELRGICDWCQTRGCCAQCISKCQICSRRLCGHCRRGFAGTPAMTVCPICQRRLLQRQATQDRQMMMQQALQNRLSVERLTFERELARRREYYEAQEMQLKVQSAHWAAQLQVARLRLDAGLPPFPQKSVPRLILGKVIGYVRRLIR